MKYFDIDREVLKQFKERFGGCGFLMENGGDPAHYSNKTGKHYDLSSLTPEEVHTLIKQSLKEGKDLLFEKVKNKEVKIIEGAIY